MLQTGGPRPTGQAPTEQPYSPQSVRYHGANKPITAPWQCLDAAFSDLAMAEQKLQQLSTLDEICCRKIRRGATGPITIVLRATTLTVPGLSTSIAADDAGIQITMLLGPSLPLHS
jgi:hypothetical protein